MIDALPFPALLAFFVAAASPGPATLSVSTTAMAFGMRPSICLAIGLAAGLAFWGLLAAAGLGALLVQSTLALTLLRWFGGAYLLWLAWQSARTAVAPKTDAGGISPAGTGRMLMRGLLLNLANPKAVLAWISILALGVGEAGQGSGLALTTALCSVLGLIIYVVYAALFSLARIRSGYHGARRWIDGLAAAFFGFFGIKLLLSRAETI